MRTLLLAIFVLSTVFTACKKDDVSPNHDIVLSESEIPAAIKAYVSTHFGAQTILTAVRDLDDQQISYELVLSGGFKLEFNQNHQITEIEGTSQLPNSVIPASILSYVTEHYPNNQIFGWELENSHQQVTLNNGTELEFTLGGEFIRVDSE